MSLPTDAKARKDIPIYSGFIKYFPLAIAAVAELSRKGNDQHNPGKPLHWDRSKSGDELDALARHLTDEASGTPVDTDEVLHLTKVAWRSMAALQKKLEEPKTQTWIVDSTHNFSPPKAPARDWIEWAGGMGPVSGKTKVDIRLRDGTVYSNDRAGQLNWEHMWGEVDIVAYRIVD